MSEKKPWEDVEESEETKRIKAGTEKLRMNPIKVGAPPKPPKMPTATDAWSRAAKFARRNRGIEAATRPIRKAMPGQGE